MGHFDPNVINDQVLALMEQHGTHWTKPWIERTNGFVPMNAIGKHPYHGMNVFILLSAKYTSPYWATYKQWASVGAQVLGGEKGHQIILFRFAEIKDQKTQEPTTVPVIRTFTVFNSAQVQGWTEPEKVEPKRYETQGSALVDGIMGSLMVDIRYGGNVAYYSQAADYIGCPEADQFRDPVAFDGTRLHELGHWTGDAKRMARDMGGGFGSESYAREELVAELFSLYIGLFLGIEIEMRADHAQYLNNWKQAIKGDKWVFYRAAKAAEKAMRFVTEKAGLEAEIIEVEEQVPA